MPPLNAADFLVIRADRENWGRVSAAKFSEVIDIPVQDDPRHARGCRGARHMRQGGCTHWLKHDRVGMRTRSRLNDFQQLLALTYGIVLSIDDLYFNPKPSRCLFRGRRLLELIIVIAVCKRD